MFGKLGLSNFRRKDEKKKMSILNHLLQKQNFFVETLKEEILTVTLKETEFEYREESYRYLIFG